MSEITFNDNNNLKYKSRVILGQSEVPKMTKFLIGKGIVKNEKSAQNLLLWVTVSFLLASVYVFAIYVFDVQMFNPTPVQTLEQTPEQIQRIKERRERVERLRQERLNNTTNTQNPQ